MMNSYEIVYVKGVGLDHVYVILGYSLVARRPGAKHHPISAIGGSWAVSPVPGCCLNITSSRPGWVGSKHPNKKGWPVLTGHGWPQPRFQTHPLTF
jgi:hypothetical protein